MFTLLGCKIVTAFVGIIFRYNKFWGGGEKRGIYFVCVSRKTFPKAQVQSSSAMDHMWVIISALDATWIGKAQAFLVCILGIDALQEGKNGGVSGENDLDREHIYILKRV